MIRTARYRLGIVVGFLALTASWTEAGTLTCSSATTLDALVTCIRTQMPGSGSNGYRAPSLAELDGWRLAVQQMLQGSCSGTLPQSLAGIASRRLLVDTGNGKAYCVLMEVLDANNNGIVDRGWGTFIVDPGAVREISHQAPHPLSDIGTEAQAIELFRDSDSRSFLMAGTHRNASTTASTCQSAYRASDVAHNAGTMFQAANEAMSAWYGADDWWAIQWHGMAADSCASAEVYISHGSSVAPATGDKNLELKAALLAHAPAWMVAVPGSGACSLNGTDNVLGRLMNGVPASAVCNTAASGYSWAVPPHRAGPELPCVRRLASRTPGCVARGCAGRADRPGGNRGEREGDAGVDGLGRSQRLRRLPQQFKRRSLRIDCHRRRGHVVHRPDAGERDDVLLRRQGNERERRERQFE